MTNSDWYAEVEDKRSKLSNIAPSSDLFDGELFGDELIDIYNVAVGAGTHPEPHENEIPSLPPQQHDGPCVDEINTSNQNHIGAQVAATAAAIDDGLGAFRPSTSFNDLTTLVPAPSSGTENPTEIAQNNSVESQQTTDIATDVNGAPSSSITRPDETASSAKRRATTVSAPNKIPKTSSPKILATSLVAAVKSVVNPEAAAVIKPAKMNTPNPLSEKKGGEASKHTGRNKVTSAKKSTKSGKASSTSPDAVSSSSQKGRTSDADFKSVAQAAVSSLILNTKTDEDRTSKASNTKIDTSTEHVKALTGSNWVTACSVIEAVAAVASSSSAASTSSGDAKSNNDDNNNRPTKRQNLTADERARQNRDRNREHARNTRLRKKAYVEELKRTLTELVAQRDKMTLEKRQIAQREVEQREVRFRVLEEFLKLRGRNEANFSCWTAILTEGFSLTLPATDFQEMLHGGSKSIQSSVRLEQVLSSISEVMSESSRFYSFLQCLGKGAVNNNENVSVGFVYHCDRENFFMDDNNVVLDWTASSIGAMKKGANAELTMRGSIRACFCPASNKLLSANIVFDTGAVHSQMPELTNTYGDAAAAQAASHQADAFLDSLQMPHLGRTKGADAVAVVPQGDSSDEGL